MKCFLSYTIAAVITTALATLPAMGELDIAALQSAVKGSTVADQLRLHDEVLWLETLLGQRDPRSIPAELARLAAGSVGQSSSSSVLSRHRALSGQFFDDVARRIIVSGSDRAGEAMMSLTLARQTCERRLRQGRPATASLQLGLRAAAVVLDAEDRMAVNDPFSGETARVAAALAGEPVVIDVDFGSPPSGGGRIVPRGNDDVIVTDNDIVRRGNDDIVIRDNDIIRRGNDDIVRRGDHSGAYSPTVLAYHQITTFDGNVTLMAGYPVLSGDGGTIVFADKKHPHPVYMINADGTDLRKIASESSGGVTLDISHDGRSVLVSDMYSIRAIVMGGGSRQIVRHDRGLLGEVRLSGDGRTVVYSIQGGGDRGIYRIGADGRGRRRVVSPAALATHLNVREEHVGRFKSNGSSLDVSHDGGRLVFAAHNKAFGLTDAGAGLFTVRSDGSSLRRVLGPVEWIHAVGISGNGVRVAYIAQPDDELPYGGVAGFDGYSTRKLATLDQLRHGGSSTPTRPLHVSTSGARVLMGQRSIVFECDGSGVTPLTSAGGYDSRFGSELIHRWPSADLRRAMFMIKDGDSRWQLATVDVDPMTSGLAPSIGSIQVFPFELAAGTGDAAHITADVSPASRTAVRSVSCFTHRNGVRSSRITTSDLRDDGSRDDGTKDDGRFGSGSIKPSGDAPLGSYFLRLKAESRDARDRAHAIVLEAGPIEVIALD